jgi:hypothetical protein
MHMMMWIVLLGAFMATAPSVVSAGDTIRVGHFPNVTHVQGLVAHHLSRTGRGWFEQRLGPEVKIEWYIYNAQAPWKPFWRTRSISPMWDRARP